MIVYSVAGFAIYLVTALNDKYTQQCIDCGVPSALYHLLTQKQQNQKCLKELLWTISNITAGTKQQIIAVIQANIFPFLMDIMKNGTFHHAMEAMWACSNATVHTDAKSREIVQYLVECGLIESLCTFLTRCMNDNVSINQRLVTVALECIGNILECDDWKCHRFAIEFESNGGVDFLEYLQSEENVNEDVYERVVKIIKKYFNDDDGDDFIGGGDGRMNDMRAKIEDNQFVFGVNRETTRNQIFRF